MGTSVGTRAVAYALNPWYVVESDIGYFSTWKGGMIVGDLLGVDLYWYQQTAYFSTFSLQNILLVLLLFRLKTHNVN